MAKTIVANLGPFEAASELNDSIARSITPNDIDLTNDPNQTIATGKTLGGLLQNPVYESFPLPKEVVDMVNHPSHYALDKYECKEVLKEVLKDLDGYEGFCIGNVIKYCWRLKRKGKPVEDAKKAAFYIKDCIEYMESKNVQEEML